MQSTGEHCFATFAVRLRLAGDLGECIFKSELTFWSFDHSNIRFLFLQILVFIVNAPLIDFTNYLTFADTFFKSTSSSPLYSSSCSKLHDLSFLTISIVNNCLVCLFWRSSFTSKIKICWISAAENLVHRVHVDFFVSIHKNDCWKKCICMFHQFCFVWRADKFKRMSSRSMGCWGAKEIVPSYFP